ncbi:MAG: TadE/TadG family type IV pilus assembly protein [Eubacteriales bacterium]|nr:TadE/TadG family type IV pilus assembly protein [Eubacteriales bacterium]
MTQKAVLNKRSGSLSLEAAVVLPIVLLIIYGMVSQITATTARIKLTGALERTADEISLSIPAVSTVLTALENQVDRADEQAVEINQEVDTVLAATGLAESLDVFIEDSLADWLVTTAAGPWVMQRINYWLEELADADDGLTNVLWPGAISRKSIFLDWQTDQSVLWIILRWDQNSLFGSRTCIERAAVPFWADFERLHDDQDNGSDSIWSLGNFERGKRIRSIMGANLPETFPVIARFENGTATSIKSMDLTATSYQDQSSFEERIQQHLQSLHSFCGADYHRSGVHIEIAEADITCRRLLLVIPENSTQPWLNDALSECSAEAGMLGLELEVVRYGISGQTTPSGSD